MGAKPAYSSLALNYGTDANYTVLGDAHDGAPTKVAPASGALAQGFWRPGRQIAGQLMNWVLGQFASVLKAATEHIVEVQDVDVPAVQANLDALAQRVTVGSSALTFGRPFTDMGDLKFAAYDEANRLWYVCGNAKNVHASQDFGGWFAANELAAVGPGSEDCTWLDVDTSGNVVVATNTRYAFEKTASTGAWTRVEIAASGINGGKACSVVYNPVHAKWCLMAENAGGGFCTVWTSTNRTAWSAGTAPFGFLSTDDHREVLCKKATGRLVSTCVSNVGTTAKVAVSNDGGTTWIRQGDLALGFAAQHAHLSYDPDKDAWYLAVSRYSGGYQSEVWRSTDDGVTWTRRCALASSRVLRIAAIDSVLVSVATHALPGAIVGEEVVFSVDEGATWHPTGMRPMGSTALGAFTSPNAGAALVMTSTHAYVSGRTLQPSWAPLA